MSYRVLNDGRERTPVAFMRTDALAASNFLKEREDAGLPVPTRRQVKRAQELVDGNPMLRRYRSPLGIQQLALEVPMSRADRRAAKIELQPRRVDSLPDQGVRVDPSRIEEWLRSLPELPSPEQAAAMLAGQAGYDGPGLAKAIHRVERWTGSPTNRAPCGHIREKARMLDAIAVAVGLIPQIAAERAEKENDDEG